MERIGEYLVKRLIGEGGMGKVYEAEERLSKRRVALKVLRAELTQSEDGRRLFLNEMQILARLEHPNLVRSLASMEADGQLVMVLEYLHGRTLRQEMLQRGAVPWHEAIETVWKIAEALQVAHGQEPAIVHRDLKPENVMLTVAEGGKETDAPVGLKVMDFGVAKVLEGHATNTQSIGTLQYMSPEQIDAGSIDARSDLYSLGLIFYELVAGGPPFRSASPRELLNMQCTAAPPGLADDVRRGLPRGVEDLLFALLAKDPKDRPESAADVIAKVAPFRAAADRTAAAPPRAVAEPAPAALPPPESPPADAAAKRPATSDTMKSAGRLRDLPEPPEPRIDTLALVDDGASAAALDKVPTWIAVAAIVALSVVVGGMAYAIRMKATDPAPSPGAASTIAAPR